MKVLILESKWVAGRPVSAGEIRDDLTDDEAKFLRAMGSATASPAEIARREKEISDAKTSRKKQPELVPA